MIALREVFNFALSNGRINNIPEFPKVSTKREAFQPRPSLTEEEWVKFNQVLRNFEDDLFEDHENQRYYRRALRDWCQLISYSGLRTGEASLLKWKDWTPDRQGDVVFARFIPIIVVAVPPGHVYTAESERPIFFFVSNLNVFAMSYPNAIANATAVPAGSANPVKSPAESTATERATNATSAESKILS